MTTHAQLKQLVSRIATAEALAESFCELDDDAQALFFVHVARIAATWEKRGFGSATHQAHLIGEHLKTCSCATEDARAFVRNIHDAMVET